MRLIILVPSEEYKGNAGARIRYGRVMPALDRHGVTVTLEDISKFDPRTADCELLVVSKCYDARAIVAAEILSQRGILVGVDLFDDYFSQAADVRLARFRGWLRQMLARCNFAMCSTTSMEKLIGSYAPTCPVHVMNDPANVIDTQSMAASLREKYNEGRTTGRIRLAWFGVGDNPHFPVGLSDLAAFSDVLRRLESGGLSVHLSVITNPRALDVPRLAMIAKLPATNVTVGEWSEDAEAKLLRDSFAAFLPVNAQSFSAAKSLNRAVTALVAGCQVLTRGYPLYSALKPLIYDNVDEFIEHFGEGRMRLAPDGLDLLQSKIDELGSAENEAEALLAFLEGLETGVAPANERSRLFLINGVATNGTAHKMVQAVGGLSVGTPFCATPLNFDVVFERNPGRGLAMLVSDKALSRLLPQAQRRAAPFGAWNGRNFWRVSDQASDAAFEVETTRSSLPLDLALYPSAMSSILAALEEGFGPGATIISENSPIPFVFA